MYVQYRNSMSTGILKKARRQMVDKYNHMQYTLQKESIHNIHKALLLTHTQIEKCTMYVNIQFVNYDMPTSKKTYWKI